MEPWAEEDARGIGKTGWYVGKVLANRAKGLQLAFVHRMCRFIGTGQVA
jgi:hypothetical protein